VSDNYFVSKTLLFIWQIGAESNYCDFKRYRLPQVTLHITPTGKRLALFPTFAMTCN